MISIIICSRKENVSDDFALNIAKTIGCPYEIISIDNSANLYSIFEAYTIGIEKSKGNYLCFIHDDILFHSTNWGEVVNRVFDENPNAGLLGIAGSKIKSSMPSAWWHCPEDQKAIKIIQHTNYSPIVKWDTGFSANSLQKVVVIDGVFMALRKETTVCFSNEMKGFHNYDLNISFECKKKGYAVFVTNEILIEHFSDGFLDKTWAESAFKIHSIYKDILPLSIQNENISSDTEAENAKIFIKVCFKYKTTELAFIIWKRLYHLNPFSKYHLKVLKYYFKSFF